MKHLLPLAALLVVLEGGAVAHAQARPEVTVQTSVSRTALWLGDVVTYTVSLICRRDVEVLQEDLGADKLTLEGLQVVGHTLNRSAAPDGTTRYDVVYRLTTFDPGQEMRTIGGWTVRYATANTAGTRAPARDLRIPGAVLAWRSALPPAVTTMDIRGQRPPDPAPPWWGMTRTAGLGLVAMGLGMLGWLVVSRGAARLRVKPRRRMHRASERELQNVLGNLRQTAVGNAAQRLAAYGTLEAAIRRHAAEVTALPALALTPSELRNRVGSSAKPLPADEIDRILTECQQARYQPIERLPGEAQFNATIEAAAALFGDRR